MKNQNQADYKLKTGQYFEFGLIFSLSLVIILFLGFRYQEPEIDQSIHGEKVAVMDQFEILRTMTFKEKTPPQKPTIPIAAETLDIPIDSLLSFEDFIIDEFDSPDLPGFFQSDTTVYDFIVVEKKPKPIGGYEAIKRYVKYPAMARKVGIEGQVVIEALINKKGEVTETKVVKSLGPAGCDEAAIAAIQSVSWEPAEQRAEPVNVRVNIPLNFRLSH